MGSLPKLLRRAIALRSIYPRLLSGPGSSPIGSHRKRMAPIVLLTSRSSACSAARTSAGAVHRRSSQVEQRCPSLPIRAVPTISLKIEPPVAAAARPLRAAVLRKTPPKRGSRPGLQGMGANAHYPRPRAAIGAMLALFGDEIDAPLRPDQLAGAIGEQTRPAELGIQSAEDPVQSFHMVEAACFNLPGFPVYRSRTPIMRPFAA